MAMNEEGAPRADERLADRQVSSLRRLVSALPDILYVLDGEGRFVYLNDTISSLGYAPTDLVGRHFTELLHPEDRSLVSREAVLARIREAGNIPPNPPKLFDERRSGLRMTRDLQVRILRGDGGGVIYCSVNAYGEPLSDPGLLELFDCPGPVTVGVVHDVTPSVLYQRALEEGLASKALLLRNLHHRVRDNLQVVASLVHLERGEERERDGLAVQIRAIAMVHEALSETEGFEDVEARDYFKKLAGLLSETYGQVGSPVSLEVAVGRGLHIEGETLSRLALVAVGFVHRAYSEAFPAGAGGRIEIGFSASAEGWELALLEDGLDRSEAYRKTPDYEIAAGLAGQLGGSLSLEGGRGMCLRLAFPAEIHERS